jgi:hypothetical protein
MGNQLEKGESSKQPSNKITSKIGSSTNKKKKEESLYSEEKLFENYEIKS